MRVSMDRFEEAIEAALESIPARFQTYLDNVQFIVEDSSPEGLMGLYEGATALGPEGWLPERITVYKRAHEEACANWDELVEEVRRTVLHEVGHHFAMDEGDLPF